MALTYNQDKDGKMTYGFDPNSYKEVENSGWDTVGYDNIEGGTQLKLYTVNLPKSQNTAYALFNLKDDILANVLKHDRQGKNGEKVTWNEGEKQLFIRYGAHKALQAINVIEEKNKFTLGYATSPESSSNFNTIFLKELNGEMTLGRKGGIKIIPTSLFKNSIGITINYELAKELGCDANDIAGLEHWIKEHELAEEVYEQRLIIEQNINKITGYIEKNDVKQNYQFADTSDYKREANQNDKKYLKTDTNAYLSRANDDKWHGIAKKKGDRLKSVTLTGKENKDYEISEQFYDVTKLLQNAYEKIKVLYDENNKNRIETEKRAEEYKKSGKFANLDNYIKTSNHQDTLNSVSSMGNLMRVNRTNTVLNNTLDNNGKALKNTWQIKSFPDAARKLLQNLFGINNALRDGNFNKELGVLVFDDNIAGGSTLDETCLALKLNGWKNIIPLSFGVMNKTGAVNISQGQKQAFRDKYQKDNGIIPDKERGIVYYDSLRGDKDFNDNIVHFGKSSFIHNGTPYYLPYDTSIKNRGNCIAYLMKQGLDRKTATELYYVKTGNTPGKRGKKSIEDRWNDTLNQYIGKKPNVSFVTYNQKKYIVPNNMNNATIYVKQFLTYNNLEPTEDNIKIARDIRNKTINPQKRGPKPKVNEEIQRKIILTEEQYNILFK